MRAVAILISACALIVASTACGGGGAPAFTPVAVPTPRTDPIVIGAGQPLTIGVSLALSGDQQPLGEDLATAAEMAAADYGGNFRGHPIVIERRDDGCTVPEQSVLVARQFVSESNVVGVVGPMCTVGAQAANRIYEQGGVVHISPSATRDALSEEEQSFFFRTAWRDGAQARVQAQYALSQLDARTAYLVHDSEPYGSALADAFAAAYSDGGGKVVDQGRVTRGSRDFETLSRQVADAAPAVVVFEGLNPEGALLLKALRAAQYAGAFIGPDGLLSIRDFIPTAGSASEGAILTGGPAADQGFVDKFVARAGRPPGTPFVLQAYDAVTAILRAIETVATDGEAAASLSIDRVALADTVRTQRFAGLSGSITFDEHGERRGETPPELGLRVYQIENATFVIVQ